MTKISYEDCEQLLSQTSRGDVAPPHRVALASPVELNDHAPAPATPLPVIDLDVAPVILLGPAPATTSRGTASPNRS